MSTLIPSKYSKYSFTDRELIEGSILTTIQKQVLQNETSLVAEQILSSIYDPLNPLEFVKQDAYLKGQIQAFQFLLDRSEESERLILTLTN